MLERMYAQRNRTIIWYGQLLSDLNLSRHDENGERDK